MSSFKSVLWYDIIYYYINHEVISWYIERNFPKKMNVSQYWIISICQRTINSISCALQGASLISKNCIFGSTTRSHEQHGFRISWKLCLNLCSCYWLGPRSRLVRYLTHLHLWQLKTLFGYTLTNFNDKLFLKIVNKQWLFERLEAVQS